jgi:hypothetical protein
MKQPACLLCTRRSLWLLLAIDHLAPHGPGDNGVPARGHGEDPLQGHAAEVFAEQLAADRVPSIREIRAQLHVGQPRAQRLQDYLAEEAGKDGEKLAA